MSTKAFSKPPEGSATPGSWKWLVPLLVLLILLPALILLSADRVQARYVLMRQISFTVSVPAAGIP